MAGQISPITSVFKMIPDIWGRFHKRFCALHPFFALYAKLLRLKKLLKSWVQGAKVGRRGTKPFMKSTLGVRNSERTSILILGFHQCDEPCRNAERHHRQFERQYIVQRRFKSKL